MPPPFHSCRSAGRDHALSTILRPAFLLLNGTSALSLVLSKALPTPLLDGSSRLVDHAVTLDNLLPINCC
jgi:hypothetical protein